MTEKISIYAVEQVPYIKDDDNLGEVIIQALADSGSTLKANDILCVASKVVSTTEGRRVSLQNITPSEVATSIHSEVPRKDPRVLQLMLEETGKDDGSRLDINGTYVAGWLPNGMRLTSAGIDKIDDETVMLLPLDPDASAKKLGEKILETTGLKVGVIITDSDGRIDKRGATQIAIGTYGVPPLRVTETISEDGKISRSEETLCDLLAASAALLMGQRGTNKPLVVLSGIEYDFDENTSISEALNGLPQPLR